MTEKLYGKSVLYRRDFNFKGLATTEIILGDWEAGRNKVIWCRTPFQTTVMDGKPNPLFHRNYSPDPENVMREAARRECMTGFTTEWKLPMETTDLKYLSEVTEDLT